MKLIATLFEADTIFGVYHISDDELLLCSSVLDGSNLVLGKGLIEHESEHPFVGVSWTFAEAKCHWDKLEEKQPKVMEKVFLQITDRALEILRRTPS